MKKLISLILVVLLAIFCFTGCTKQGPDEPGEVTEAVADQAVEETEAEAEAESKLIGSWESVDMAGAIYRFDDAEKGAYLYGETEMPFTYTDNSDSVSILYDGNTAPNDFKYEIDGDTLIIEDSFGSKVEYKKK